jgi:hypothetical protein
MMPPVNLTRLRPASAVLRIIMIQKSRPALTFDLVRAEIAGIILPDVGSNTLIE